MSIWFKNFPFFCKVSVQLDHLEWIFSLRTSRLSGCSSSLQTDRVVRCPPQAKLLPPLVRVECNGVVALRKRENFAWCSRSVCVRGRVVGLAWGLIKGVFEQW